MERELKYIRSSWKYILIVTCIFIFSLLAGLLVSLKDLGLSENYLEILKNSFGWIKNLSPIEIMLVIFLNNAVKSLFDRAWCRLRNNSHTLHWWKWDYIRCDRK